MYIKWILLMHISYIAFAQSFYARTPYSLEDLHKRTFYDKLSALYNRNKIVGNAKQAPFLPSWATMYNKLKNQRNHLLSERKNNIYSQFLSSASIYNQKYVNAKLNFNPFFYPSPSSFFSSFITNPNTYGSYYNANPSKVYWVQHSYLPKSFSTISRNILKNDLAQPTHAINTKRTDILTVLNRGLPKKALNYTKLSYKNKLSYQNYKVPRTVVHGKLFRTVKLKPINNFNNKDYFITFKSNLTKTKDFLNSSIIDKSLTLRKKVSRKYGMAKFSKGTKKIPKNTFKSLSNAKKSNDNAKRYSSKKTVVPHAYQQQRLKKHHMFRATDIPSQPLGEWEYRKFRVYHEIPNKFVSVFETPYNFDEEKSRDLDLSNGDNELVQEFDINENQERHIPILNIITHADDDIHAKNIVSHSENDGMHGEHKHRISKNFDTEKLKEEDSVRKSVLSSGKVFEENFHPEPISTETASKREMSEEELEAIREDQRANSLIKASEEHKIEEPETLGIGPGGLNPIDKSLVTSRMQNAPIEGLVLNNFNQGVETNPLKQNNVNFASNDNLETQKEMSTSSMYQPFDSPEKQNIHPTKEENSYDDEKSTQNFEKTKSFPLQQSEHSMQDYYERHNDDAGLKSPIEKFSNEPPLEMTLRSGDTTNLEETINQLQSTDPESQKLVNQFTSTKSSYRTPEMLDNVPNNINPMVSNEDNSDISNEKQKEAFDDVLDPEKAQERALHFSTQAEINKKLNHDVLDPQAPGLITNSEDGFQEKTELLTPPTGLNELPYKNKDVGETVARNEVKSDSYSESHSLEHEEAYNPRKTLEHTEAYLHHKSLEGTEAFLPQKTLERTETYLPQKSFEKSELYSSHKPLEQVEAYSPHNALERTEAYSPHNTLEHDNADLTPNLMEHTQSYSSHNSLEHIEKYVPPNPKNTEAYLPNNPETSSIQFVKSHQKVTPTKIWPKVGLKPVLPSNKKSNNEVQEHHKETNDFNPDDTDNDPKSETMSPEDALNALNNINLSPHHAILNLKSTRSSSDEIHVNHSENDSPNVLTTIDTKTSNENLLQMRSTPIPIISTVKTTPFVEIVNKKPSESTTTLKILEKHKNETLKNNSVSELENAKVTKEVLSILESLGQLKTKPLTHKESAVTGSNNNTISKNNQSQSVANNTNAQQQLTKINNTSNEKSLITQEDPEEKETKEAVHDLSIAIGILERKLALIKAAKVSGVQNGSMFNAQTAKDTVKSIVPQILNPRSNIPHLKHKNRLNIPRVNKNVRSKIQNKIMTFAKRQNRKNKYKRSS
ncbi:probable WRKY transcription factor protein 1 isoform X2 [Hydra vulgaris]|uniref:Probable WRKY transcription factor protein 1 isoform X2 n=1 Tax=Hydra vulgaris TaxID=6087 RepID=A0ABM4D2G8_HYDVU